MAVRAVSLCQRVKNRVRLPPATPFGQASVWYLKESADFDDRTGSGQTKDSTPWTDPGAVSF
jgi:hypothetical protein